MTMRPPPSTDAQSDNAWVERVTGFLVAGVMFSWMMFIGWLVTAPRDPGGIICRRSSSWTMVGALFRGQVEVGCTDYYDQPIIEAPLFPRRK